MTDATCVLCEAAVMVEETDRGNRTYIACTNTNCGDYEISKRAACELGNSAERKEVLREMVSLANQKGQVLEIFIAADGVLQASAINRG